MNQTGEEQQSLLLRAAKHIKSAIGLLDAAEAPGNIAAHLDLALHQLRDEMPSGESSSPNGEVMARGEARGSDGRDR